jgi:hypothetical protein
MVIARMMEIARIRKRKLKKKGQAPDLNDEDESQQILLLEEIVVGLKYTCVIERETGRSGKLFEDGESGRKIFPQKKKELTKKKKKKNYRYPPTHSAIVVPSLTHRSHALVVLPRPQSPSSNQPPTPTKLQRCLPLPCIA